ncbi:MULTISPECIES: CHAP domain-containing protein [Bifidobacterium]|nr:MULTISPECIES: CHAP domain-containing protein [Bifidobacterium]
MGIAALSGSVVPIASADTYSDLLDAQAEQQASADREAELRSRLAGVNSELADKIVELDKLTNTTIPAAQDAVTKANDAAAQAQQEADALAARLAAAQKDKQTLEAEIAKTGEDYDDAHAAVAQMARDSMHGSNASDVMSVVTGSTSTKEFVNSMQTRDALSRTESNAASDAAVTLNTSMNRSERLAAIETTIAQLKVKADDAVATAQAAAADAKAKRDSLEALRVSGEAKRSELESLQDQLEDSAAKEAASQVLTQSRIDALNEQYAAEQAAAAQQPSSGEQGTTDPNVTPSVDVTPSTGGSTGGTTNAGTSTNTGGTTNNSSSSSGSSSSAGTSSSGQGTSNGDSGNAYAAGQCTWYAYNRRKEMGIGTPSYLGNGGEWWATAPSYGLRVDRTPQVGAALSFLPGQDGSDGTYGHVAVVEAVYSDGTFLISEMNWGGLYMMHSRVLTNSGQYWFVH